jgi:hypothetical protein
VGTLDSTPAASPPARQVRFGGQEIVFAPEQVAEIDEPPRDREGTPVVDTARRPPTIAERAPVTLLRSAGIRPPSLTAGAARIVLPSGDHAGCRSLAG